MRKEIRDSHVEYKYFVKNYVFPLLGMSKEINFEECDTEKTQKSVVYYEKGYLFFATFYSNIFKVKINRDISEDNIKLAINVVLEFFVISKFRTDAKSKTSKNNEYSSKVQQEAVYKMAVQKGICNWVIGERNEAVEELFQIMERWSVQTYEGRQVCFAFVINPDIVVQTDNKYGTWFDFLEDDFSAVFTDCVNSIIELDRNCNFSRYRSITEDNKVDAYPLTHETSYRFSSVMQQFVTKNRVGVFLLNNGDIIISKEGAIKFVRRNLKWLNFSYEAFKNSFGDFIERQQIEDSILREIFASMLDVSFSHTGGIISVVSDIEKFAADTSILSVSDNLLNNKKNEEVEDELIIQGIKVTAEIHKRILKRNVIMKLIDQKDFVHLDRKLRCELISLDGACILDKEGRICSCGAIIKNDSGSSGGGRGAASKKLSSYGFAIKISTDGYIELYINRDLVYTIK